MIFLRKAISNRHENIISLIHNNGFATVEEMEIKHSKVDSVEKGNKVGIKLDFTVRPKDKVFLWKRKSEDG